MHECYTMQILEKQRKQKQQITMVTKSRAMKHKDHARKTFASKTQLDRAFCIQNFLDATLALELFFKLEF